MPPTLLHVEVAEECGLVVNVADCTRLGGFQHDIFSRLGDFLRQLGGVFLYFGRVLNVFGMAWRRLEALCCFANDLKASWRRLRGVLETP